MIGRSSGALSRGQADNYPKSERRETDPTQVEENALPPKGRSSAAVLQRRAQPVDEKPCDKQRKSVGVKSGWRNQREACAQNDGAEPRGEVTIDKLTTEIEVAVKNMPGVTSALGERLTGGRYIDVDVDRLAAARYGLSVADVQAVVSTAIGGENVGEVIQGRVRYPREVRDSLEKLCQLPFVTEKGATVLLQDVARVSIEDGPPMLRSENARLSGWVYVDVRGRNLRSVVSDMQAAVAKQVAMPAGYAVSWSGQFEYLERVTERLKLVVPVTLAVIFVLLYLLFRSFGDATLVMAAVPFSLVGGFWLILALGHSISVATAVGFIALAGVAAEFGVVMLIYLKNALSRHIAAGEPNNEETLLASIREGAVLRVRRGGGSKTDG